MKYKTIVADPPWRYDSTATKADAGKCYGTMSFDDICKLPVPQFCEDDCHLWLWTTNAFMEQAHILARFWKFRVMTIVTWCKNGPGVGHYLRNNTEHCLFATTGDAMVPDNKPLSTWYQWPKAHHSAKPEAFIDLVEQVSPGPYLELFARRQRLGWHTWGNEAINHVDLSDTRDVRRQAETLVVNP